jgi:dienelactone hydrolase
MSCPPPRFWLTPLFWAVAALVISSCSVRRVDAEDPARRITLGERHRVSTAIWPQRPHPDESTFKVNRGTPPIDEGIFKNCRVYKAGEVRDGMALILAGRRWQPIVKQETPFHLTVVGRGGTNEIELKSEDHRITLAVVRAAKTAAPRGLVLYLSSINLISREEKAFIKKLQERGWNVAAITPSIDIFSKDRWPTKWSEDQVETQATLLAREIDNYLAETAYVGEAVLAYLQKQDPMWVKGSRVVIGASAGALAAPALIDRIGKVDAAVFIGGGANVPEILLESNVDIYHPKITIPNAKNLSSAEVRLRKERAREQLIQSTLKRSRLDPLHLAPTLPSTPTLMLSGELDWIVPAHTGTLLYHALGRPERWRYPTGHILLFISLPFQGDRVADWLERAVEAGRE